MNGWLHPFKKNLPRAWNGPLARIFVTFAPPKEGDDRPATGEDNTFKFKGKIYASVI